MGIILDNISLLIYVLIVGYTIYIILRKPIIGLWLVGIVILFQALWGDAAPAVNLGMVSLYPLDILAGVLCAAAFIRYLYNHEFRKNVWILLITLCLIFCGISFLEGMQRYGLERAGNYARPYIYLLSVIFYSAGIRANQKYIDFILKLFALISGGLLLVGLIRLYLVHQGYTNLVWLSAGGMTTRVLNASQAFFLLQTLLLAWFAMQYHWKMPLKKILPYILIVTIIFLQHRTVWVMAVVCILVLLIKEKRIRSRIMSSIILGVIIIAAIGMLVYGSQLFTSLKGSASNPATFLWRTEGWKSLMQASQQREIIEILTGNPFGTGYAHTVQGNPVDVSPHNYYLQVLLDTGIFGLTILGCVYGFLIFRFIKENNEDGLSNMLFILIVSQLLFFITYSPGFEQGLVLGLAIVTSSSSNAFRKTAKQKTNNLSYDGYYRNPAYRS